MARFEYDDSKVSSALTELEEAKKTLDNVNTEINAGISIIQGARGSNFISVDFTSILGLKDTSIEYIDTIISDINKNVATIEEYNSAPWYKKVFATIGMAVTKLGEGLATGGEQIVDGFASLTGMVVGVFSSDAKESIGNFIEKDHVGDAFAASYESGILSGIEKYSAFSSTSTAANVFKGVGVATTYIALAAATGGAGAAIGGGTFAAGAASGVASVGLNAAIAGVGGLGAGTQSGLQEGKSYNSAFMEGVKDGAISAGTVFVAGKIGQKFTKTTAGNPALTEGTPMGLPAGNSTASLASGNLADDASRLIGEATTTAKSGVQYTAGTIDDLARLKSISPSPNNLNIDIDMLKSINAKGYVYSDGTLTVYDAAGKTISTKLGAGNIFESILGGTTTFADDATKVATKMTSVTDDFVDDFASGASKVETISPDRTFVKNADGTFTPHPDASFATKVKTNLGNASIKMNNVGSKISSAASTVGEKVSPIATNAKEVFRSVGTEIATNPVAEGTVIAQGINGIRTASSDPVATAQANYVFNSNGTVSEKTGETVSPVEETTANNTTSTSKTTSQNVYNNTTTSTGSAAATSTSSTPDSTVNIAESTTTVDNVDTITTETTAENIDNSNLDNNIDNNSSNETHNTYNEYTTNNYTTNRYNTTNNYNTSNTNTTPQTGTTIVETSGDGKTTTTVIQERIKYATSNNAVETPTSNTETVVEDIKPSINSDTTNSINTNSSTITNKNNFDNNETITPTPSENTSSASTIKKVLGTVAGVGAVGSAAGLGYKAYKKYENGDFSKKRTNKENDTEDEYNFVDGEWHEENDISNDYDYIDDEISKDDNQEEYE